MPIALCAPDLRATHETRWAYQGVRRETRCGGQVQAQDNALSQTLHSPGDLPPAGADGCGVSAILSTEVPGNIAEHLNCPSLNIGASECSE
jgi:hypothetical protein